LSSTQHPASANAKFNLTPTKNVPTQIFLTTARQSAAFAENPARRTSFWTRNRAVVDAMTLYAKIANRQ
jgi:hypothetical protein